VSPIRHLCRIADIGVTPEPLVLFGNLAQRADSRRDRPGALFAHVAAGMPGSSRPLIVCLSSTDWGFLRYRKQQLMERLSRQADVVYVNPPRAMKSREWPFRPRTRWLSPSLWVHEPFVMPGMRASAIARQITYRWLALRPAAWRKNRPFVLWLYSPHGLALVDLLKPDRLVYDICDLHATPSGRVLRDEGERAAAFADAVERALNERTPEHVATRRDFAARHTWDVRVAHIADALADIGITLAPADAGVHRAPSEDRETAA